MIEVILFYEGELMTDIEGFIGLFQKYKGEQENQRKRGLNDFNIFTTLLNKSDEVRLHSRFLHFLLNPIADHREPRKT